MFWFFLVLKTTRPLFQKATTGIGFFFSYSRLICKSIWSLPCKYFQINKIRDVSFKMIHRFYPADDFLNKYMNDICVECNHCFRKCHLQALNYSFLRCTHAYLYGKILQVS